MKMPPLIHGKFVKRYKRFFADVILDDGREITAHVPNTGRMTSCLAENAPVLLSQSDNPKRKLPYTLELICPEQDWIVTNTHLANQIVYDALLQKKLPGFQDYELLQREPRISEKSKSDFLLQKGDKRLFLEVKAVTMKIEDPQEGSIAVFPDAPSARAQKHLDELLEVHQQGKDEAALLFLIQRGDVSHFKPAEIIDPLYAEKLALAYQGGLPIYCMQTRYENNEIEIVKSINFTLNC